MPTWTQREGGGQWKVHDGSLDNGQGPSLYYVRKDIGEGGDDGKIVFSSKIVFLSTGTIVSSK